MLVPSGTASAAKSHLTQSLPLSPGSPYPNTGWRQGRSLINRQFNKHAVIDKFQLRVCFPGNPTWNNSLDQNPSPKGLDAAFVFTPLCFCPGHPPGMSSSTYPSGKILHLPIGQNPAPSSRSSSHVPSLSPLPMVVSSSLWTLRALCAIQVLVFTVQ